MSLEKRSNEIYEANMHWHALQAEKVEEAEKIALELDRVFNAHPQEKQYWPNRRIESIEALIGGLAICSLADDIANASEELAMKKRREVSDILGSVARHHISSGLFSIYCMLDLIGSSESPIGKQIRETFKKVNNVLRPGQQVQN